MLLEPEIHAHIKKPHISHPSVMFQTATIKEHQQCERCLKILSEQRKVNKKTPNPKIWTGSINVQHMRQNLCPVILLLLIPNRLISQNQYTFTPHAADFIYKVHIFPVMAPSDLWQ